MSFSNLLKAGLDAKIYWSSSKLAERGEMAVAGF